MDNLELLNQLLNGNHLSDLEIERVTKIIDLLNISIKGRLKN